VARRVGYDLFFPWAQKTVVVQVTTTQPSGYTGLVQIVDERGLLEGQRSIASKSDDCADLTRALALTISIAVDDRSLEYIPPPAPSNPAPPPAAPSVGTPGDAAGRPEAPASAPPASISRSPVSLAVWLTPLIAVGTAPSAAFAAEAEGTVRFGAFSLGLGMRGDAPASLSLAGGGSVTTWMLLATFAPCLDVPFHVASCALAEAGLFGASGHDIAAPHGDSGFFAAAGGRVMFTPSLGGGAFFVSHVDVLGALNRRAVDVNSAVVFTQPPVSLALGAGLGFHFR
jgi:hypothetical protein